MDVTITVRGPVPAPLVQRTRERITALERFTDGPLTDARVVLTQKRHEDIESAALATGEIVFAGRRLRAHATAPRMGAAVDELADRLTRQLREYVDRLIAAHHAPAPPLVGLAPGAESYGSAQRPGADGVARVRP